MAQVVTVHDLIHLSSGEAKYRLYYEKVLKPAIRRAGVVITVSDTSKMAIEEWLSDTDVSVVNCGNGYSRELHVVQGERRDFVLYVGNLKRHKNVRVVLEALKISPELRLIAVTPDANAMTELAASLGVSAQLDSRMGVQEQELAELYAAAAATILPSTLEGFGLPALESLMAQTPVVYWRGCKSVAEIVGDQGVAVDSASDPHEWASAMVAAVGMRPSISIAALEAEYSWESVAERVNRVLQGR